MLSVKRRPARLLLSVLHPGCASGADVPQAESPAPPGKRRFSLRARVTSRVRIAGDRGETGRELILEGGGPLPCSRQEDRFVTFTGQFKGADLVWCEGSVIATMATNDAGNFVCVEWRSVLPRSELAEFPKSFALHSLDPPDRNRICEIGRFRYRPSDRSDLPEYEFAPDDAFGGPARSDSMLWSGTLTFPISSHGADGLMIEASISCKPARALTLESEYSWTCASFVNVRCGVSPGRTGSALRATRRWLQTRHTSWRGTRRARAASDGRRRSRGRAASR